MLGLRSIKPRTSDTVTISWWEYCKWYNNVLFFHNMLYWLEKKNYKFELPKNKKEREFYIEAFITRQKNDCESSMKRFMKQLKAKYPNDN